MFVDKDIKPQDLIGQMQEFDLLAGSRRVEDAVDEMAAVRRRFSTAELGELAGVGVMDQYSLASAEVSLGWWKSPLLLIAGLYALIALCFPLLGFAAGLAIDVAVFGGAMQSLIKVSPIYAAFAIGSLVFAVGVGIAAKGFRIILTPLMLAACLGASLIAADNPAFSGHFANALPGLKTEERARERDLALLEGRVVGLRSEIAEKRDQLAPRNGPPMLQDGTRDNDEAAYQLIREIALRASAMRTAQEQAGAMRAQVDQARRDNPAQRLGRLFAAFYIFCWLAASQIVIALVIMSARSVIERQRQRARGFALKRRFVRWLDGTNRTIAEGVVAAAVTDLLTRFNQSMTRQATGDADKLDAFTELFQAEPFDEMRKVGVSLVCKTLAPRRTRWPFARESAG